MEIAKKSENQFEIISRTVIDKTQMMHRLLAYQQEIDMLQRRISDLQAEKEQLENLLKG